MASDMLIESSLKPPPPLAPFSYGLGRLHRTIDKYITAKATSNTPPTIKIKAVTILNSRPLT